MVHVGNVLLNLILYALIKQSMANVMGRYRYFTNLDSNLKYFGEGYGFPANKLKEVTNLELTFQSCSMKPGNYHSRLGIFRMKDDNQIEYVYYMRCEEGQGLCDTDSTGQIYCNVNISMA